MVQPSLKRKLFQAYNPATFVERGVLVPFTTPVLAGTRARPGERGCLDLIVPNPSGGEGVYILPWDGVRELCRPTVHDIKLNEKIAAAPGISPSSVRLAARAIAAEGLAGRGARAAAESAALSDKQDRVLANFLLATALRQQVGAQGDHRPKTPSRDQLDEMQALTQQAVSAVAPLVGKSPESMAARVEDLALMFDGIGVEPCPGHFRHARSIEALRRFHDDMKAWSGSHLDQTGEQATLIASVAELTIGWAQRSLAEAVALTANVSHLLRRWETDQESIRRRAARPDWMLDGWEHIRLLWETASSSDERRAVLPELAALVPPLPREACQWAGVEIDSDHPARRRMLVGGNEDWRTGSQVLDLVARNERVRACAA